jgi:IS5 family transposase
VCAPRPQLHASPSDEPVDASDESMEVPHPRRLEHPIGVIKRIFGFTKVRYRGLAKNRHRLVVACTLANLFMMRKRLPRLQEP